MELLQYSLRKLITGIPLIIGVTLISFLLMVYFGPDKTFDLLGKNPTAEEIAEIREQLGYNKSFKDQGEFWSRTGLLLGALSVRDELPEMRAAMATIMVSPMALAIANSDAETIPERAAGKTTLTATSNLVPPNP